MKEWIEAFKMAEQYADKQMKDTPCYDARDFYPVWISFYNEYLRTHYAITTTS